MTCAVNTVNREFETNGVHNTVRELSLNGGKSSTRINIGAIISEYHKKRII